MQIGERFLILSYILNFGVIIYFISFLIQKNLLNQFDLWVNFLALFISVLSNIISIIEKQKGG